MKYKQNKKKHDFEEIVFFNDKLYVFTSLFLKREKEVKYFYGKLNMTTLQLEGELIEFASEPFSENKKIGFISVTSHEDRIMVYQSIALLDGELEKFKCLVFNKKMELEEFSVQLPYVDEKYVRGKFTYDGKDKIYLLGKEYLYEDDNPAKLIKKVMHFICYDLKSHEIVDRTIGLGDDMPSKDMLRFNSETGEFLIAGFYSKNHTLDQGGVFFCKVNPDNMVMSEVVKKDFDKEFILSFYSEEGGDEYLEGFEEDNQSLALINHKLRYLFPVSDGGIVLLVEKQYDFTKTSYKSDGSGKTYNCYAYNDIIAIKLSKSNKIDWCVKIPKLQKTCDDLAEHSSFILVENGDNLDLYYNDFPENLHVDHSWEMKYELFKNYRTRIIRASLTLDGEVTREIMHSAGLEVLFDADFSHYLSDNQILTFYQKYRTRHFGFIKF
ncbi:MAG: hypothetical protein ACPGED_03220 [Flavobacteriales bacterium]